MKKQFKKTIDSLNAVFTFVHDFLTENDLDDGFRNAFDLALEELFVNLVRYNPSGGQDVQIEFFLDEEKIRAVLTDPDADEYDINTHAPYDKNLSLEERRIGGIGIHLVKQIMDEVSYEYRDRTSCISLTKYLRKTHV